MSARPAPPSDPRPLAATPPSRPRLLPGMAPLAPGYDGFILDLWGVVHDGVAAYPGVADCLGRLKGAGKGIVLLSNAPRRVEPIARAMAEMGVARGLYDHIVSSGEETHRELRARRDPWVAALGRRCYHIGPDRDRSIREGLDFDFVDAVDEADFVLNTGPWRDEETVADFEGVLARAARRALPMVCANPDVEVIRGGRRVTCAGALAHRYEELGGEVRYHGKPFPSVYRRCFELLGAADLRRVLAVGDSLRTDIAGADGVGIDSVLVTGGLHAEEMESSPGGAADIDRLAEACAAAGHVPIAAIPAFVW